MLASLWSALPAAPKSRPILAVCSPQPETLKEERHDAVAY